jgi:hypothetical protein
MPEDANFAEKAPISRKKRELQEKNVNFTEKARTSRKKRGLRGKGANFAGKGTNFTEKTRTLRKRRELRGKGANLAGKGANFAGKGANFAEKPESRGKSADDHVAWRLSEYARWPAATTTACPLVRPPRRRSFTRPESTASGLPCPRRATRGAAGRHAVLLVLRQDSGGLAEREGGKKLWT